MANYQTPGVYVEEVASLPGSIAGVPTAVPCFIGYTDLHSTNVPQLDPDEENTPTYPVKISSMMDYERIFGGPHLEIAVDITESSTTAAYWEIASVTVNPESTRHLMYPMLQHYFMNGGGPCYVVSVATHNNIDAGDEVDGALYLLAVGAADYADEVTLLVLTDITRITTGDDYYDVALAAMTQCHTRQDRMVILDFPASMLSTGPATFRTDIGSEYLSYAAVYGPKVETSIPVRYANRNIKMTLAGSIVGNISVDPVSFSLEYMMLAIEGAPTSMGSVAVSEQMALTNFFQVVDSEVKTQILALTGVNANGCYILPPSGAIAGIYAKTDRERGVWVAPANVSMAGVKAVTERFTPSQLDGLNVPTDGYGKAINVIRTVQGRGHMVMGARTLLGNSLEWRYVSVRRTFLFIEESIQKALAPVVFEPNDFATWNRIRTMIANFLTDLWRQGALLGKKPEEAFFVKAGLGSTMTPEDILVGKLNVDVGIAVVRPAEFIILRFSHLLQQG
jgi:phage tail sheath protein FI